MSDERKISRGDRIPITIEDELKNSYLAYAMSVIIGRALPDVRDGLKPVHRRILYGMHESGSTASKPYRKSARIVGDVMGKYHPHGDQAIYDTAVRMAQVFSMRNVLIDGQGNFGSVDGDAAAAMRYTEVRLTRLAEEMIGDDIAKETVDWVANYDGSLLEPTVLPARIPNLLVNGSSGIAVGMATNIPPHNLGEIVDACKALIENPDITFEEMLKIVPGPDFPTAGIIHGRKGIVDAYRTGRGIIRMRARTTIEEADGKKRARIIIDELPYQVNKANLVEKIASLVHDKKLEGIADLRDESDRDGIRVVIELKRDAVPEVVQNNLFKMTAMQSTFGTILLAVTNNQPKVFTLREILEYFIEHRKEVVTRRTRFDLRKAQERAHILEGLVIALDNLDEVIRLIRQASDSPSARDALMESFGFSTIQAQAILDMRLHRLTGLEREKITEEYRVLLETIAHLEEILKSPQMVLDIIVEELDDMKSRFADPRRSEIREDEDDISIEDLIAEEDMVITVSREGYIKRSAVTSYRAQRRGGRGRRGMATKNEDPVVKLFVASTHATMLFFTTSGKVFARKVYQLPETGPTSRGRALINLLPVERDERIAALLAIRDFSDQEGSNLLFATRNGKVKRTPISAYANIRTTGIRAVDINEGDHLLSVHLTNNNQHIFMGTHAGMGIRFPEQDARLMGRVSAGVRGIKLREGDWVEEVATIDLQEENDILVVTDLGFGKRTLVSEFRIQQRGGYGVTLVKLTKKNGSVAAIRHVHEDDQVMMVSEGGMLIRINVDEISRYGRAAQGVRVIRLSEGDRVISVAKIVDPEDEDDIADSFEEESVEAVDDMGDDMAEDESIDSIDSIDS